MVCRPPGPGLDDLGPGGTQLIIAIDASSRIRGGRKAENWVDTRKMHLFDPTTGENLTRDAEAGARITAEAEEERREEMEEAKHAGAGETPDAGGDRGTEPTVDVRDRTAAGQGQGQGQGAHRV